MTWPYLRAWPELVPAYLSRQRWYAGSRNISIADMEIVEARELCSTNGGRHRLHWLVVEVEGERYQLLVGERPDGEPAGFLNGQDVAFLGALEHSYFYDAVTDSELLLELLPVVTAGVEFAAHVRPISAEQSNTSLVYDDRIIVKFFRRLLDAPNPDVDITTALARAGFDACRRRRWRGWRHSGVDYAFAQQFLAGGTDGWALAQTSLRDFYNLQSDAPSEAGGDFSAESRRLGRVTAELHRTMAQIFGIDADRLRATDWGVLVDDIERRLLASVATITEATGQEVDVSVIPVLRGVADPGPATRVHGDYHLGQVMRTDSGWYILGLRGRARLAPCTNGLRPALKDLTGMLRSLDYASQASPPAEVHPSLSKLPCRRGPR